MPETNETYQPLTFDAIKIGLASPEKILEWSHGEVKKPETINYRTLKPEKDGLFCEKIFGPSKDWECHCGKYKKIRYKGVICDRCGVEVTKASVRRERVGHIALAAPVSHIWYFKGIPSRMGLILDISPRTLEKVLYFASYIVLDPGKTSLQYKQVLSEKEYRDELEKYGYGNFRVGMGAEAIQELLQAINLEKDSEDLRKQLKDATGQKRARIIKRLEVVEAFRNSGNKPEWMIMTVVPVIPPDIRPMVQLDGGRFATSDLNDLYRRIINRNNRLARLLELGAPDIIVRNEKRMLQEAVDALIDNGRRGRPVTGPGNRALKSLSDMLKGKQGRFRQNLLGKRVDYSGRSVIVVGPELKIYQCGLPKEMAIELFKPFVMKELVSNGTAHNIKNAKKMVERLQPEVWDVLEDVIKEHPVMLNRAPTLHRLGIQAFEPILVEGKAIKLHPLVCTAFNADFDGDQMAVHVPLSEEARAEALVMMLGSNNILGPKDGKPIVTPGQDMVMGNFYLTMEETAEEFYQEADRYNAVDCPKSAAIWTRYGDNEGHVFGSINEILMAYQTQQIHLHSRIAIPARALKKESFTEEQNKKYLLTTVGKVIFNNMFPTDFPFLNEVSAENFVATPERFFLEMGKDVKEAIKSMPVTAAFKKKDLGKIIGEIFKRYSTEKTSEILDQIKDMGFQYSTVAGVTVSLSDIEVAPHKEEHVEYGKQKAEELKTLRKKGKLTMMEWERHLNKLWADVKDDIAEELLGNLPRKNPISMMARSGARGNTSNFTQLAGMRGLMAKPNQSKSAKGEYVPTIIEVPIYSCFREGLNVSEFFISTHGVRKGLTDTALKTAESGYLTRRLVDVAQDVIVKQEDCGTDKGYWVEAIVDRKTNTIIESLFDRLVGRYSKQEITDPKTGEVILESDEFITDALAQKVVDAGVEGMYIRSAFTCKSIYGVCKKCYGRNMATGKDVEVGEAVGIMAAQSIGEPGTQLTMRTFHTGGVASADGGDITQGLPRVEELFEARCPKGVAVLAQITGEITDVHQIDTGYEVTVSNDKESIVHKVTLIQAIRPWMKVGAHVEAGDKITEGQVDPKELLKVAGVRQVQNYILKEVKKVYQSQGIEISDKHVEVMIRQMLRKVVVLEGNDTHLNPGVQISLTEITKINRKALLSGQVPATFKPVLLGISKASVETDSFLSAASFQETTKVLTDAAIKGKKDYLIGLKENVIIGKLIPAGTGVGDERPMNLIIGEKAKELKEIREERNHKEDDDNFMAYVPAGPERLTTEMVQQIMDGEDTTLEQPAVEVQE